MPISDGLSLIPQQPLQSFPLFSKPNTCPMPVSGDLTFYSLEKSESPTKNAFSFLPPHIKMSLYPHLPFHSSSPCPRKIYPFFLLRLSPLAQFHPLNNFCRFNPSATSSNLHQQAPLIPVSSPQPTNISISPTPRKKMLLSILLLLGITNLASPQTT